MTDAAIAAKQSVRAGIVGDPAEYRWSGYGAAVGGEPEARRGLCDVVSGRREGWGKSAEAYRMWLFETDKREKEETPEVIPEEGSDEQSPRRRKTRRGVDPVKRSEVLSKRGKMSVGELIRHRVRYFSDGAVIGSREFVEAVFEANRERFGPKRQTGARRIGESVEPFFSLRQLRRRPVG